MSTRKFLLLGAATGLLLSLAEPIPYAAPIQFVAFVPFLLGIRSGERPWHHAAQLAPLLASRA